jgi:hypothetical protein
MIEEVSGASKAADVFRSLASLVTDRSHKNHEKNSILAPILARFGLMKTRV